MKSAEQRAFEFTDGLRHWFSPSTLKAMREELTRSFKEHAADQRAICAEQNETWRMVMDAPEPGKCPESLRG